MSNNTYLKLDKLTEFIILYFKSRNLQDFGFCRYGIFRKIIHYALDTNSASLVRRVFDLLRSRNVMDECSIMGKPVYLFNPYHRDYNRRLNCLVDWLN